MVLLAFLQNPYSPGINENPEKLRQLIWLYENHDWWKDFLRRSKSGARLNMAFGDLYDQIIWRNANPTPADNSTEVKPFDAGYIRGLVMKHEPDVILCFGKQAVAGVATVLHNMPAATKYVINCVHPSPRMGPEGLAKVVAAAGELREILTKIIL